MKGQSSNSHAKRISQEKEGLFKSLSKVLADSGIKVRREELKSGPGWRALSGQCRANEDSLVFVDKRLDQDDQISFLVGKIIELGVTVPGDILEGLPAPIQSQLAPKLAVNS